MNIELCDDSILLEKYCKKNDVIEIRKMIEMNVALIWDYGLWGASVGGHIDIVKSLIEKGANDWHLGLYGACRGGHIDIINFMIEKGATECWNCEKSMEWHLSDKK